MHKLFSLTREAFELPVYVDQLSHKVCTVSARNLPTITWPNGRWCLDANIYMLELFDRGHSRQGRGGTLAAYASNISHLLRFCFDRSIDFDELSDGQFTNFITQLRGELRSPGGVRVRDDNTVLAIGRNCLDFLQSVSTSRQITNLLGKNGQIRAYRRAVQDRYATVLSYDDSATHWHHSSFPKPDAQRRRFPIGATAIQALKKAATTASNSVYLRRRRLAMIQLLEMTGGRRIEVAQLKVADVMEALNSPTHALKLYTAKRRGGKADYRYIPVAKTDLEGISRFIEVCRKQKIRKTIGKENDHDIVLVNERTGMPLRANTITQEILWLAKVAKLPGVTCPHMFRHRFITKIFVGLIHQHQFENKDDLRRALISTATLKQKVMEWTGQRRTESFDRYVDLAFEEIVSFRTSFEELRRSMEFKAIHDAMDSLASEFELADPVEGARRLKELAASMAELLIRSGSQQTE